MLENKKVIRRVFGRWRRDICYVCLSLVNIERVLKEEFGDLNSTWMWVLVGNLGKLIFSGYWFPHLIFKLLVKLSQGGGVSK